ncbi:MAG: hypothetical protein R3C26_08215 [Calditrichia bacterium]
MRLLDRTRKGGGEIVGLLKTGSAYYATSAAVLEMVESIVKDKKRICPVPLICKANMATKICIWVLIKIGKNGVEKVFELALNDTEKAMLENSAEAVRGLMADIKL